VYLVDSPGVGESKEMNKKVLQYLPKAAAFIYIVNSSVNGGGISENRVSCAL
jgi:predicted GTPase